MPQLVGPAMALGSASGGQDQAVPLPQVFTLMDPKMVFFFFDMQIPETRVDPDTGRTGGTHQSVHNGLGLVGRGENATIGFDLQIDTPFEKPVHGVTGLKVVKGT